MNKKQLQIIAGLSDGHTERKLAADLHMPLIVLKGLIQELEKHLGVELLVRHNGLSPIPTEHCHERAKFARRALANIRRVEGEEV